MRYLAVVSYEGTNYGGWQIQPNSISVEEEIEKVLSKILNTPTKIYGSGRTDKGVHALGQTFHFDAKEILDLGKFKYSLNSLLPNDIHILSLNVVNDDFNARFAVKNKTYEYRLNTGEYDLFKRNLESQFLRNLDVNKMKECLPIFIGEHCFQNYTSKEDDEDNFIRTIYDFSLSENYGHLVFKITGNGFMRYMVRIIIGSLIEVGLSHLTMDDLKKALLNKERNVMPYKASPNGLYLVNVSY